MLQRAFRRLLIPLALLGLFVALLLALPTWSGETREGLSTALDYAVRIGLILCLALVVDRLLAIFFWEGLVARSMAGQPPGLLRNLGTIFVFVIAVTVIVSVVFRKPLTGFWATSGVVGLFLGFALRNIIMDLFTGVAVNIDRPYTVGDWVHVQGRIPEQDITGQVVDINWRTTRLQTEEQTSVVLPNSLLGTMVVTNLFQPAHATRFDTEIVLDSTVPVDRARRILRGAVLSLSGSPGFVDREPDILIDEVVERGVHKVRYWIEPWEGTTPSRSEDLVQRALLAHLRQADLAPSLPKTVFYSELSAREHDGLSLQDRSQLLRRVDLLASLDDDERSSLARRMRRVERASGQDLLSAGEDSTEMFILAEGLLEVISFRTGSPNRVAVIEPGECVGEMSLFAGHARTATVRALTDIVAWEITTDDLQALFDEHVEVLEKVGDIVAARLAERSARIDREEDDAPEGDVDGESRRRQVMDRLRGLFRRRV